MGEATKTTVEPPHRLDLPPVADDAPPLSPAADGTRAAPPVAEFGDMAFTVHEDLAAVERDWRAFERHADATVFQTFDWLACWQHHIGARHSVRPAIVVGRDTVGTVLFIFPLAVRAGRLARELVWLGAELCDYNAPLLTQGFGESVGRARFLALWDAITQRLKDHPHLQFDLIKLTEMPEQVGAQANPFLYLPVTINPSGAYLTHLTGDWETFYAAKRSSSTRRRDRTKRKRLAEFGEIAFVNPKTEAEIIGTLDTLMAQKARSFARMGVGNLFAKPGYADFYRDVAASPATRQMAHVSSLNVGATAAAINLGLTWRSCYYHLLASYDDGEVSRFGPGAAHLHDLLHLAIDRGFRVFDFTIGDERYKRDWCDTEIKLYDTIAGVTARGSLVAAAMTAAARAKRWIKQTPAVWNAFSASRAFIGSAARLLRG
jgi:CelD/BcsL family acetyltransferase involved in cellulose biosynthesis